MGIHDTSRGGKAMKSRLAAFVRQDPAFKAMYQQAVVEVHTEHFGTGSVQPKYSKWFRGEVGALPPPPEIERAISARFAEKAKALLLDQGQKTHRAFSERLKVLRHWMMPSFAVSLIPGQLTHGTCRFGQVAVIEGSTIEVSRFFVCNGLIEIDTDQRNEREFLKLVDRSRRSETYFGLAQSLDRSGNYIGVNRDHGHGGVLFKTTDRGEALMHVASISTGKTLEEIRGMALRNGNDPLFRMQGDAQPLLAPAPRK